MSKIVRPKTPFEFCAYPVLKEALEKTNYNQTELAQSLMIIRRRSSKSRCTARAANARGACSVRSALILKRERPASSA